MKVTQQLLNLSRESDELIQKISYAQASPSIPHHEIMQLLSDTIGLQAKIIRCMNNQAGLA